MFGATAAARELRDYVDSVAHGLEFKGDTKPQNPKQGDYYYDRETRWGYVFANGAWTKFATSVDSTHTYPEVKKFTRLDSRGSCLNCGAPYSGQNNCRYCQTLLIWYH